MLMWKDCDLVLHQRPIPHSITHDETTNELLTDPLTTDNFIGKMERFIFKRDNCDAYISD